jgi:sulfate adenylyltransferase subunit 1
MTRLPKRLWRTGRKGGIFNSKVRIKNRGPGILTFDSLINMDILRFITAGSVDDGKSTLIGRLLYDSKNILIDQLEQLERQSKNKESGEIDLAYLTDGLRAEREQGITIDVAYRYFSTPKRKFIIADAPGHVQYTRNMITGASNANLIIILIDARQGVVEQTRGHSIIASLLNIPHVVVAINKMDLVNYSYDVFNNIVIDYAEVVKSLGLQDVHYIPVSALNGDNIVERSGKMDWYEGESLLSFLENIEIYQDINLTDGRFPVQYVIRPQTDDLHDYRGYAGKIISGIYKKGDKVTILPSRLPGTIKSIEIGGIEVEKAFAPQSAVIQLEDDIDISRGDVIVKEDNLTKLSNELDVLLCWMDSKPLIAGNKYYLQLNSRLVRSIVREIEYKLNVNTLEKEYNPAHVGLNDIVKATIKTASEMPYDPYVKLRTNGGAILIDETSNVTVGACMIQ